MLDIPYEDTEPDIDVSLSAGMQCHIISLAECDYAAGCDQSNNPYPEGSAEANCYNQTMASLFDAEQLDNLFSTH